MPIYEFITDEGVILEHSYPMAEAPSIGDVVTIAGQRCTRIIRPDRVHGFARRGEEFTSWQVNPKHPAIEKRDRRGRAVFGSRREAEKFCERSRKLAETKDPTIPAYEFDAASSMERCDQDSETARLMKRSKEMRATGEALRGMGFVSKDTYLEGE